jgi:hypothetical protein
MLFPLHVLTLTEQERERNLPIAFLHIAEVGKDFKKVAREKIFFSFDKKYGIMERESAASFWGLFEVLAAFFFGENQSHNCKNACKMYLWLFVFKENFVYSE